MIRVPLSYRIVEFLNIRRPQRLFDFVSVPAETRKRFAEAWRYRTEHPHVGHAGRVDIPMPDDLAVWFLELVATHAHPWVVEICGTRPKASHHISRLAYAARRSAEAQLKNCPRPRPGFPTAGGVGLPAEGWGRGLSQGDV